MHVKHLVTAAAITGFAGLGIGVPFAGAEPPPSCAPDDQQCRQQQENPGPGIADEVIDNVQDGVDRANEALQPERGGPGIMVLKDGVPWCMPFGQPIPPGAVISKIDPSGLTSYC